MQRIFIWPHTHSAASHIKLTRLSPGAIYFHYLGSRVTLSFCAAVSACILRADFGLLLQAAALHLAVFL